MCKMSNYIHKMLLNTRGTASIVFLVYYIFQILSTTASFFTKIYISNIILSFYPECLNDSGNDSANIMPFTVFRFKIFSRIVRLHIQTTCNAYKLKLVTGMKCSESLKPLLYNWCWWLSVKVIQNQSNESRCYRIGRSLCCRRSRSFQARFVR